MEEWTGLAFVLRIGHFRETDLWVRLLLPDKGVLTAFAFGGSKSIRRLPGCLDVLNTLECHIRQSPRGPFYILKEASLIKGPKNLRTNWQHLGIASNCIRFLEVMGTPEDNAPEIFSLMENVRYTLDEGRVISSLFPWFFRFHLASLQGYVPGLSSCTACGTPLKQDIAFFHVDEGQVLCRDCAVHTPSHRTPHTQIPIHARALLLLNTVAHTLPTAWSHYDSLSPQERQECSQVIDNFIEYHLGIVWKKGVLQKTGSL